MADKPSPYMLRALQMTAELERLGFMPCVVYGLNVTDEDVQGAIVVHGELSPSIVMMVLKSLKHSINGMLQQMEGK